MFRGRLCFKVDYVSREYGKQCFNHSRAAAKLKIEVKVGNIVVELQNKTKVLSLESAFKFRSFIIQNDPVVQ